VVHDPKAVATLRDHVLEIHDDFAEHLTALKSGEAALEIGEWNLGVDDGRHAGSNF
jgi:hypothetical protein